MCFGLKNDDGIELYLTATERKLVFDALRHYSAYGKNEKIIIERVADICEIMNVLELPEYREERVQRQEILRNNLQLKGV